MRKIHFQGLIRLVPACANSGSSSGGMYGVVMPSYKNHCHEEHAVVRKIACKTKLALKNTQGKRTVAIERRIWHRPIRPRRFPYKKIETNSSSSLAGRKSLGQTQRCILGFVS